MPTSASDSDSKHASEVPSSWLSPTALGLELESAAFPSALMLAAATLFQRNVIRPMLEQYGIGVAEWRVLISINRYKSETAVDIVNRSWMDKAQVSRACLALERRGFIERAQDPDNAKRVILLSTRDGRKAFATLYREAKAAQSNLLLELTNEERRGMYKGLQKVISYAKLRGGAQERNIDADV